MIKKYKNLEVDIKLLDGVVILGVLLLSLVLYVRSFTGMTSINDFFPAGILSVNFLNLTYFYVFQILFAFILAVELEEVYFNHKKAHVWVLIITLIVMLYALSAFIGAFGLVGVLMLALMIYILSFRFKKMMLKAEAEKAVKMVSNSYVSKKKVKKSIPKKIVKKSVKKKVSKK
jgi:hypothetical protein